MDELVPIIEKFTGYRWDAIREKFDTPTEGAEDRDAGDEEQPLRNKYELRPETPPRTHSGFKRLDSPGSKRVTAQQVAQRLENELKPIKMQADRLESANRKLMAAVRQLEIKDLGVRELPAHPMEATVPMPPARVAPGQLSAKAYTALRKAHAERKSPDNAWGGCAVSYSSSVFFRCIMDPK